MPADTPKPAMSLDEVRRVLKAITETGARFWVEGGWGVDALAGRQTRPHRDLDIDLDADYESHAIEALKALGYEIETDWRPNRVELIGPGLGWVDLHPLLLASDGSVAKQHSAVASTSSRRRTSPPVPWVAGLCRA